MDNYFKILKVLLKNDIIKGNFQKTLLIKISREIFKKRY